MYFIFSSKSTNSEYAIAVLRIIVGGMMIYHGWEVFNAAKIKEYANWEIYKNSSSPLLMPYIGKSAELISGVLLTLGLLTRIAAIILIGSMCYITFVIGNGQVWYGDQHPFMLLLFGALFLFTGPGKWSLDKLIFKEKSTNTFIK